MDVWSVEESFDDLFGDFAADLLGRFFRDLLDEFPEDVVHMSNPFLSVWLTRGTREAAAQSWASFQLPLLDASSRKIFLVRRQPGPPNRHAG